MYAEKKFTWTSVCCCYIL